MPSLIEEMARVIRGSRMRDPDPLEDWIPDAQAALSVVLKRLREPSEEFIEAGKYILQAEAQHGPRYLTCRILRALADHLERDI